jgi:NAD+ kinase
MPVFKSVAIQSFLKDSQQYVLQIEKLIEKMNMHKVKDGELPDLVISIGGDGTLLHHAKYAHQHQIPILGINAGQVGFLADVECDGDGVLESIFQGHFIEDDRIVLSCEHQGEQYLAINEVMVSKVNSTQLIRYEAFIDDRFVYEQLGDGLIVSTPTGSTAYSLSAGGQILHPNIDAVSLVPVCSRHLSSRVLTIPATSEVKLNVTHWKGSEAVLSIDANAITKGHEIKSITIKKHAKVLKLIHPRHYDFYDTLQNKLNWETKV